MQYNGAPLKRPIYNTCIQISLSFGFVGIVLGIVDAGLKKEWLTLASQLCFLFGYTAIVDKIFTIKNMCNVNDVERPSSSQLQTILITRSNLDNQQQRNRTEHHQKVNNSIHYVTDNVETVLETYFESIFPIHKRRFTIKSPDISNPDTESSPSVAYELCYREKRSQFLGTKWDSVNEDNDRTAACADLNLLVNNHYSSGENAHPWEVNVFWRPQQNLKQSDVHGDRSDFHTPAIRVLTIQAHACH